MLIKQPQSLCGSFVPNKPVMVSASSAGRALARHTKLAPGLRFLAQGSGSAQRAAAVLAPAADQDRAVGFVHLDFASGQDAMQIELNLPGVEVPAIRDGLRPGSFAVQALLEVQPGNDGPTVTVSQVRITDPSQAASLPGISAGGVASEWGSMSMEAKWQELFEHKESWVDQRGSKQGRQPDFKARSDRTRALWLDSRGLPSWVPERVSEEFGEPVAGQPVQAHSGQPQSAETDFSQLLAGGPAAYYDNRVGKRNPLSPDFKHKDSGASIWLTSRDGTPRADAQTMARLEQVFGPPQAQPMSQYPPQQYGQQQYDEQPQQYGGQYSQPEQYGAYQPEQPQQYSQPEAAPAYAAPQQAYTPPLQQQYAAPPQPSASQPAGGKQQQALNKWQEFFKDPAAWDDNRLTKTGNQPDFKHKSTREALWLNGAPAGVAEQLGQMDGGQ